ncbi:hypothetical protein BDD12DRAFT_808230 [Trichophaea hybrida]|nr:hypothetical protein BDD12DRAFT_808230 [Trichophaea hybrida]
MAVSVYLMNKMAEREVGINFTPNGRAASDVAMEGKRNHCAITKGKYQLNHLSRNYPSSSHRNPLYLHPDRVEEHTIYQARMDWKLILHWRCPEAGRRDLPGSSEIKKPNPSQPSPQSMAGYRKHFGTITGSVFRYAIVYSILPLVAARPIGAKVDPALAWSLILMSVAIVIALYTIIERKSTFMTSFGTLSRITVSAIYMLMGMYKSRDITLQTTTPGDCIVDLDADLAGVGVRASLYVQGIVASGILFLGLVHREDTGVKEIGASLMLSQLALTTSLALRMKLGTLNHLDAIFGLISLDAQLAAVSMLLSTKQVLAARWMVILVCFCHLVGFATLGIGMGRFKYVVMVADGCENFTIGWYGITRPFQGPSPVYWLYFTWRIICWVRNQWVCFCVMDIYNEKEREEKYSERTDTEAMPDPQSSTADVPPCSYQQRSSTIFTDFFGPLVAFWVSVDTLNKNIQIMDLTATSEWKTTGQFTAILLAAGSVFRVLWLIWRSATNPAAFSTSHMWLDCDNIPMTPMQQPTTN